MSQLGTGVIINILGGNEESVAAYLKAEGQTISALELTDDRLCFTFRNGYRMQVADEGQSCCEHRYMVTDDTLSDYVGAELLGAVIKDAPNAEDEYGDHEVQFLEFQTSKGSFVMKSHNEHNGYYGGFYVAAREIS